MAKSESHQTRTSGVRPSRRISRPRQAPSAWLGLGLGSWLGLWLGLGLGLGPGLGLAASAGLAAAASIEAPASPMPCPSAASLPHGMAAAALTVRKITAPMSWAEKVLGLGLG
eukprot:scaffold14634_cov61-Phaeocystis_antarctica.AAC.11